MRISERPYLLIAALALLIYLPFLGAVHLFDWDEINFAESAREMLISQEFFQVQINYMPFWEKPPLFIWMQA
ncbi:MAG: glycosyltransferase family 39 protein, partial [Bacteroidota bacterium]|nr:glycosyltransferase family 39 protein [Bacteroidota bacterium]MDX5431208.1 glycosyltransferase family 39 protein [Bacteroidota bacterium]MDX5469947.1 glycosyltransferase family 39 protein [Bacteroidota bacterium]